MIIFFFSFYIYSKIINTPITREFHGIVSSKNRHYKGYAEFELSNDYFSHSIFNNPEKFLQILEIGDSVSKTKGDNLIYIYRKFKNIYKLQNIYIYE